MHKQKTAVSRGIRTILPLGEPQNFANWPAEFGKIYSGKLQAQLIVLDLLPPGKYNPAFHLLPNYCDRCFYHYLSITVKCTTLKTISLPLQYRAYRHIITNIDNKNHQPFWHLHALSPVCNSSHKQCICEIIRTLHKPCT